MAETKKPIGAEILTADEQYINLIKVCNGITGEKGTIFELSGNRGVPYAVTKQIDSMQGVDSGVVDAILFIYGRPNYDDINIEELDVKNEDDQATLKELSKYYKADKIQEAIRLIEKAVAGFTGVNKVEENLAKFKPKWDAYQAMVKEEGEQADKLSSLSRREEELARLEEREEELVARMQSKRDQIAKLRGETKEKLAEVVQLPGSEESAERIKKLDLKREDLEETLVELYTKAADIEDEIEDIDGELSEITGAKARAELTKLAPGERHLRAVEDEKEEEVATQVLKPEPHLEKTTEKVVANSEIVSKYLDQIMGEDEAEQLAILRELQKRIKVPAGELRLIKDEGPLNEPA